MLAKGCNSCAPASDSSRFQISKFVSLVKSASTAPALVPVASRGAAALGDHANAAVRGISLKRTILGYDGGGGA